MDNAFKSRAYPGCTTQQLRTAVAEGRGCAAMTAEIARREAVAAGDRSQMTDGERLRASRASVPPIHPDMLASIMCDGRAAGQGASERTAQEIALRLASPKRAEPGKPIEQQQDAAHLPLFVHANEPKFI